MENIEKTKKVIRVSVKKMTILIVILIVLILGYKIFIAPVMRDYSTMGINNADVQSMPFSGNGLEKSSYPSIYQPIQYEDSSIKDTREFLKTRYDTTIQTRDVKSTLREVKGAIKVANGRIDSLNENPKNGYVRFVVPKVNFESFKEEIESITHEKLITENISSENLLTQKQSIEEQQQAAASSLTQLQKQQKELNTKHTQTKNKLQNELASLENQYYVIDMPTPPVSPEYLASKQVLFDNITLKKQQIASENSNFNINNQNLNNQINSANNQIAGIKQQDNNFTDNIETVNGSISVRWISLWKLIGIFSPISPTILVVVLVIVLWYFLKRKNYLPRIEFV